MAGHLKLDNLVLLYDNNQVTCDGPLEWINTEDINSKMRSTGWEVFDVMDGNSNVEAIVAALQLAKVVRGKPVFINIRTTIGVGTAMAGTYKAHHGAFDEDSIARSKELVGMCPEKTHVVPSRAVNFFRERRQAGQQLQQEWQLLLTRYSSNFPDLAAKFQSRRLGELGDVDGILDTVNRAKFDGMATREVNGELLEKLWTTCPSMCGGGADLVNSNKIRYAEDDVFHHNFKYTGRYIRNGIREHAMASISNGIAAYNPGTFLPITATFLMFYLYAAPGVRMGALSGLQVIHIATHDSFAEGQNGPTHQPVEVDSLYRAMPNLCYIRPCDGEELVGSWRIALHNRRRPSLLSLARDPAGFIPGTDREKVKYGGYVIKEIHDADLTLASCGSNLHYAVKASERLEKTHGLKVRLVSLPSMDLFQAQDEKYRTSVLPLNGKPIISVEEYVATTWARYVTASIGMKSYGYSASNESNYQRFELDEEGITRRVLAYLHKLDGSDARKAGWQQI